ncbi:SDR family NAD(P)-dependent oxidoreductase [Romboutsia sp.]|uniref:SDR family NAD(P)-dependent oxidoreductase n=1 Tax=Romboutsia sp. TaxID=1965302 RepID=UPI003F31E167
MGFEWPEELAFIPNSKLPYKTSDKSMKGKTCVITGTTSGIGLETLKQLAKGGANIVMVCRNEEKALKVKEETVSKYNVSIDIVIADFSSLMQVRRAAQTILNNYPKIDVLINNIGMHSTTKQHTEEGFEMVFIVNHLSSFLFTRLLLPRLKESGKARIIQVNSEGHRFNGLDIKDINWKKRIYTGLRGYGASKSAQLLTVRELADSLKDSDVTINAVHPGEVRTNIGNNNGEFYRWTSKHIVHKLFKDPKMSGEAIYYFAADPEVDGVSGKFFYLTTEELPAKHILNSILQKVVYEMSMDLVGLKE